MTKRAFTLIELLVVIAIIAILAAILFPVFAQAKMAAKKSVTINNLKSVATANALYLADSDDTTVLLRWFDPVQAASSQYSSTQGFFFYPVLLQPYTKNQEMFLCPMDKGEDPQMRWSTCPQFGRFDKQGCAYWYLMGAYPSYGYNANYMNTSSVNPTTFVRIFYGKSATQFASPAETVMFAEATGKDIVSPGRPVVRNDVGYHWIRPPFTWTPASSADPAAIPFDARTQGQLWGRFDRRYVVVNFLDGHTKVTPINQLRGQGTTEAEIDRFWNGNGNTQ